MENPLVSIIVPVYNVEKYLDRAIDSIKKQVYQNYEVLMIDDGSTDNSLVKLEKYAAEDQRVKVLKKENGGVGSARNLGLDCARGEYIYFMDPDDVISPYLLCNNIQQLCLNHSDFCVFDMTRIEESQLINYSFSSEIDSEVLKYDDTTMFYKSWFKKINLNSPCNKIYLANFLKQSKLYFDDIKYAEDAVFNVRCFSAADRIIYNKNVYYIYIDRKNSASYMNIKPKIEGMYALYQEMHSYLNRENSFDSTLPLDDFMSFIWRNRSCVPDNYKSNIIHFLDIHINELGLKGRIKKILFSIFKC